MTAAPRDSATAPAQGPEPRSLPDPPSQEHRLAATPPPSSALSNASSFLLPQHDEETSRRLFDLGMSAIGRFLQLQAVDPGSVQGLKR